MAKKTSFEDRLKSLEKLVKELEEGELTLEQSVEHYRQGVKWHQELRQDLDRMEKKIEMLTKDGKVVPFGDQEDEPGGAS